MAYAMRELPEPSACYDCTFSSLCRSCRKREQSWSQFRIGHYLSRGASFANNKAIRSQLWAIYTLEYKNGSSHCFLDALASVDSSPAALSNIFDAVSLSHAASKRPDERLRYQAMEAYGRSLSTLAQSLSTMPKNVIINKHMSRAILISMILLGSCGDSLRDVGNSEDTTCIVHHKAAEHYVKAVGPEAFNTNNSEDVTILEATWFVTFLSGLSLRRAMTLNLSEWNSFSAVMRECKGEKIFRFLDDWFRMVIPIPEMLEQIDYILAHQTGQDERLGSLVMSAIAFSQQADSFTNSFCQPTEYLMICDRLDMSIEEHKFLAVTEQFRLQYCFRRREMGMLWLVTQFARLLVTCAVLCALFARPSIGKSSGLVFAIVERDAYDAADALSRSVYFTSQLHSPTYTSVMSIVLQVLSDFFDENGALEELRWSQACRVATELGLRRFHKVRPRSLCRIREVAPLLTAAVRYRSQRQMPNWVRESAWQCPFVQTGVRYTQDVDK